ncbi:MAG: hypothetical protein ACXAD7_18040 [Candidatus Kariarchaeaceae archaeon]|jgi:hypothetical protein
MAVKTKNAELNATDLRLSAVTAFLVKLKAMGNRIFSNNNSNLSVEERAAKLQKKIHQAKAQMDFMYLTRR